MSDRDDETIPRSTSLALPVARGRRRGERRPNPPSLRALPASTEPAPRFVSVARVRSLFERFARTVEPGSIGEREAARELRDALATRLTEVELWALMERLALRLSTRAARERFLLDVADLRV